MPERGGKQHEYTTLLTQMDYDLDYDAQLGGHPEKDSHNTVVAADGAVVADASEITTRDLLGFFFFGVINNTSYVIMIAGAKDIDPSMIGIVYLVSELPSISVKLSAPYWFHLVPYRSRVIVSTVLMACSFVSVAIGGIRDLVWLQLVGVAIGAAQSGVGEASFLALSSFYNPSRKALTAWSSGTYSEM